jgi:hypothetical protein
MTLNELDLDIEFEGNGRNDGEAQQPETNAWWLTTRKRIVTPRRPATPVDPRSERSANRIGPPTLDQLRAPSTEGLKPVARPRPWFGKRKFAPVYQWEGVVEEVNGEGFRARLRPLEAGPADADRIEYADFDFDDLADESDHDFIAEGAVFYWTVGRSNNEAGTQTKTSLVRFRRLPPTTENQIKAAAREAEALLADLREDQ